MDDPLIHNDALRNPRNRQLLIILGVVLLALLIILAIWQTTGTHGAKRDVAAANDRVVAKQKEVDDARRTLEQKLAELRAVRAEADVQATKLGSAVDQQVQGTVNDARVSIPGDARVDPATDAAVDAPQEYYVRDRRGRFVRVTPP